MAIDYAALAAKAAALTNQTVATKGGAGGDYEAPKEGPGFCRLVGYFEVGKQAGTYMGKPTSKDTVQLVIELIGKNHPPRETENGEKIPHRIVIEENYSLNEKARFFNLLGKLNWKGTATHMSQLLGEAFRCTVIHRKYKKKGEPQDDQSKWTGLAVELYDKKSKQFTLAPPRREVFDEEGNPTGEWVALNVGPALTPIKAFFWDIADKEQWDAIFIEGEYPERKNEKGEVTAKAKSKNVIQNKIKSAANFKSSPMYAILAAMGGNIDIPDAEDPSDEAEEDESVTAKVVKAVEVPTGADADDALNGVV